VVDGRWGIDDRKGVRASLAFVLQVLRARPVARRVLSGVSVLLAVVGVAILAYPVATNLYQDRIQGRLVTEFEREATKIAYVAGDVAAGDPLTRLRIPATGVDTIVVEGTTTSALRAGAGHYKNTPLPGEEGNVAIAGHRTTYGKPFADNDRLRPGDDIVLETPVGTFTYKVSQAPYVVEATDWSPISQSPGKTLTLTTCHPKGSARQRLIIKAELVAGSDVSPSTSPPA
jgi:sortase A